MLSYTTFLVFTTIAALFLYIRGKTISSKAGTDISVWGHSCEKSFQLTAPNQKHNLTIFHRGKKSFVKSGLLCVYL